MTVRPAVPADADAVARLHRDAGLRPDTPEGVRAELARPRHVALVAGSGGQVVGVAVGLVAVEEGHVLSVVVDASHRRHGIGGRLLDALLDAFARGGAPEATLEVRPSNAAAVALYQRHGFAPVGRRRRYYPDGEDALLLTRPRLQPSDEES